MQSVQLIDTLKQELRKQRVTYRQVAEVLDLSEASVKRLFSGRSFSLERLDRICELLHLTFADLVAQMEKNVELTTELTLQQERELVSNIKLLLMAHFLVNKLEFYTIIETYEITETEGIRLLARLDRMKILELLPGNRVRLMISPNFKWLPGGPIQRFFEREVQGEFLDSAFTAGGEYRAFISGLLSRDANAETIDRLKHLVREIDELMRDSAPLDPREKFGSSLLVAMRPWEPSAFAALRRADNTKVF